MVPKLRDEGVTTPPKLSLSSFPSYRPLPGTPGALTPPLQPMVSVPFLWEEAPGRPRPNAISSPCKPSSFRCLELPPGMLLEARLAHMPSSPTTVLDGPKLGRSLSHRFLFENLSPKKSADNFDLGFYDGPDKGKSKNELRSYFGPWRWASGNGAKWEETLGKNNVDFTSSWDKSGSVRSDVDIEVKMTRFKRRSKGSFYKLSHKSTRLLENIYQGLKQMVVRKRKEGKLGTGSEHPEV